jgi:hypothetical protein
MSGITKKGMAFAMFLIFMGVIGGMTILGANGSIIIYGLTAGLVTWTDLLSLSIAMGLIAYFGGRRLGLF